jgi:DNA-binding CsgD family transcriptional regulator
MNDKPSLDSLLHYGVKRKSGRYPWGSGEDDRQGDSGYAFLKEVDSHRAQGLNDTQVAAKMGINTRELRDGITWANAERKAFIRTQAKAEENASMSNTALAAKLGVSEATVRNYRNKEDAAEKHQKMQLDDVSVAIKDGVDKTGYLDVGVGVERQLGVSRTKFNAVVNKLAKDEDYHIHEVHVPRLSDPTGSKYTTVKVLTKDPDVVSTRKNSKNISTLQTQIDSDGKVSNIGPPKHIDLKRIKVRYKEDGGEEKDGLIELRPGTPDLDLGRSRYAQVRIAAGKDLYLKGMVAYSDKKNFPDGVDIIFNTNKEKGTPTEKVLKKMKDDADNPFGANIVRQKGALNIVNEEGEWAKWSKTISSQFLSKQPAGLIKDRLDDTYNGLRREFDEINSMTNPTVRKHLMDKYIEGMDSKAKHLKAKGLPGTMSHVLLPFPDMKPNEIYAPNYKNGERVVLVRHPHGGRFEIPELVVNNKNKTALSMIGSDSPDAVGIHPSVAQKLSGADFDGDTALVIPNNKGLVKSDRALQELKNFDPNIYKVDYDTISPKMKQTQMGVVSNLITDMTIKGASNSELARAVKHSMVVIDAEKHKLDYKQSARDNGITALQKKYQTHVNPDTGKLSKSASTLISRSKQKIDISQHETARELHRDRVDKDGKILKKGLSVSEIATKLKISEDTVDSYLKGKTFDPDKYSSGTVQEDLYVGYIKGIVKTKNEALKISQSIPTPKYSKEAAKIYETEVKSLNAKLNTALLNAPRERQAQILNNHLYFSNIKPGMDKDDLKKLRARSLQRARDTVGSNASAARIKLTEKEWEAIQARAVSNTKLQDILNNADMDIVRKLAAPREAKLSTSKVSRAQALLSKGYTYSEVAQVMGVSTTALREELSR